MLATNLNVTLEYYLRMHSKILLVTSVNSKNVKNVL